MQNDTTLIQAGSAGDKIQELDNLFFTLERKLTSILGNSSFKVINPNTLVETQRGYKMGTSI